MRQEALFMMNVQNQCCQFFKILIKKKSSCFLQRVVGLLLPRGWGVPIYNWKKAIYNFEKNKK